MSKKILLLCFYGILSAVCIVLSYVEHLVSLDFIAPGVKLGLANSAALILIVFGDVKGAFAVNISRILLSGLLFSSPMALLFSLSGGIGSLVVMWAFSKIKGVGFYGISVMGAAVHNIAQLVCAYLLLGVGVWYYSPILLISGTVCGLLTATVSKLVYKKTNKKIFKWLYNKY